MAAEWLKALRIKLTSVSSAPDVEKEVGDRNNPVRPLGFAALSSFLASDRDLELLIFRKFDQIGARNLLYLQCELLGIEKKLKKWDRKVSSSNSTKLEEVAESWEVMVEQAEGTDGEGRKEAQEMMKLVRELRSTIKEYRKCNAAQSLDVLLLTCRIDEALDLQSRIDKLETPGERALKVARNELWGGPLNPEGLKMRPLVGGVLQDFLDEQDDLVSLGKPSQTDVLSNMLRAIWMGKEEVSRDGCRRISRLNERTIIITTAIINIIFAIILLVGPIMSFSHTTAQAAIPGTICVFTALFAITLGLMTSAKRAEIFAASAAYTAVLMVYVSNQDLSGQKE